MLHNSNTGYGWLARLFHWVSFILLILLAFKGLSFEDMAKGPEKLIEINNHKSMGSIFVLIVALRLFWSLINPRPMPLSDDVKMNRVSALISKLIYVLMFIQPFSGILMSQAKGYPISIFNSFTLPNFCSENESLASLFTQVHHVGWIIIAILVAIHILGALKQHFVIKNGALVRIFVQR